MDNTERTLDWIPRFDPRSRLYGIGEVVPPKPPRIKNRRWKIGPILDQGREGACVGYGWAAEALSTPVPVDLSRVKADVPREPEQFARHIYRTAQTIDEWEGEAYEGTSVLAGAKAMHGVGLMREYRWAFSIDEVVRAILLAGPVVLGIEWREDMYDAPNGILTPTGDVVGGHCITAVGYKTSSTEFDGDPAIYLQNSWGTYWGNNGVAAIRVSDLAGLLDRGGEACVPYRRSYGR